MAYVMCMSLLALNLSLLNALPIEPLQHDILTEHSDVIKDEQTRLDDVTERNTRNHYVEVHEDVIRKLLRYMRSASQRLRDDTSDICEELCGTPSMCPPDCEGHIKPPWGLRYY